MESLALHTVLASVEQSSRWNNGKTGAQSQLVAVARAWWHCAICQPLPPQCTVGYIDIIQFSGRCFLLDSCFSWCVELVLQALRERGSTAYCVRTDFCYPHTCCARACLSRAMPKVGEVCEQSRADDVYTCSTNSVQSTGCLRIWLFWGKVMSSRNTTISFCAEFLHSSCGAMVMKVHMLGESTDTCSFGCSVHRHCDTNLHITPSCFCPSPPTCCAFWSSTSRAAHLKLCIVVIESG
eukprot:4097589-Amphidinium_carterae.2